MRSIETDLADPMTLTLGVQLNGKLVGQGLMSEMTFSPLELVSAISHTMTLNPGDTILCGASRARALVEPGDEVRVEAPGVGLLINPVISEPHTIQ